MAIIVINEKATLDAESVMPGVYGSTQVKGEVLIKTHRSSDPASPFHKAQWINLYGSHGFTPDRVHPAMVYEDTPEKEINDSRQAGTDGIYSAQVAVAESIVLANLEKIGL